MKRTGRVVFVLFLVVVCMAGLWLFQSYREGKIKKTRKEYHNVYITKVEGRKISGVWRGKTKTWQLRSVVTNKLSQGVSDLILEEGKVVTILQKPDYIQGKILRILDDKIEIENYGEVSFGREYACYHIKKDGTVAQGNIKDLSVGETDAKYVAASGKICAVLMYEKENKVAKIRVILQNNEKTSYDFDKLNISGTTGYTVVTGKGKRHYEASQCQNITASNDKQHMVVIPDAGGKICINNLKRQSGSPKYRGVIEINCKEKVLHVINELPLEEYLYSVVPSEMPTEYNKEALKAQAVCARTYAMRQMAGKRLADLGAHVDDSVSFQVYNNLSEDAASIAAVNETKGLVVKAHDKIAETYFYSVSPGVSAGIKEVWFAKKDVDYLPCALQNESHEKMDLQKEKDLEKFLNGEMETYDSVSPWYRWQTTVSKKQLQQFISQKVANRYEKNPTQIQTRQKDGTYMSTGQTELGEIKKISIIKRGISGVAMIAQVEGTKNTLRIFTEYNIRTLFGDEKLIYIRKDKTEVSGLSCLPSGYFCLQEKKDAYLLNGGGYGHSVGLSQYGANQMAQKGKKYDEILKFYFSGSTIQ